MVCVGSDNMIYIDEQGRWVTTQDPVNADDINRMLREGIEKIRAYGGEPKYIYVRPEVYHILEVDADKYMVRPKGGYNSYMGIPVKVKGLPDEHLALISQVEIT